MERPLAGKVAVVTGAELPLGAGLAMALGGAGAAVGLLGHARALARAVSDLEARDARAAAIDTDFGSRAALDDAFTEVAHALGGTVDVVVHAALASEALQPMELAAVDEARWDAVWEGSMRSTIFVLQAGFARMRAGGRDVSGRFVLVTPTIAMSGAAQLVPLTAVLEAQRVLAKAAARQWGASGVTVNCIAPSPEHLPLGAEAAAVALAPPALGGIGDVERDLGPIAVFLASDASHFLTGATLNVDGGEWMAAP